MIKSDGSVVNEADGINPDGSRKVQMVGSNTYEPYDLTASTSEQTVTFGFMAKSVMVTNDGTGDIRIGLQGKSVKYTVHDNLAPQWTYTGTWFSNTNPSLHNYGTDATNNAVAGGTATYKPNVITNAVIFASVKGTASGIAGFELSQDGGTTWKVPSAFTGVVRSDGATGSAMDTLDTYQSTVTLYELMFSMTVYAPWALRVSVTGNKNTNSTKADVWVDAGLARTQAIVIKPGETKTLPITTAKMSFASLSGNQPMRVVAIS